MDQEKPILQHIQHCHLCLKVSQEANFILQQLLETIIRYKNSGAHFVKIQNCQLSLIIDFRGLIDMLLGEKKENRIQYPQCEHLLLKEQFQSNTGLSTKDLDTICHRIAWKRAKYYFHLDMLIGQVVSFPENFKPKNMRDYRGQQIKSGSLKNKQKELETKPSSKQSSNDFTNYQQNLSKIKDNFKKIEILSQDKLKTKTEHWAVPANKIQRR